MIEFLSTLFTVWCIYTIWMWLFGKEARQKRKAAREAKRERKRKNREWSKQTTKGERDCKMLGIEYKQFGSFRPKIDYNKLVKWEGDTIYRLVYSPVIKDLEIEVEFWRFNITKRSNHGVYICANERIDVFLRSEYGYTTVDAPAEGIWCPVIQDGSKPAPGDVILELDTTPEALLLWSELQEKERAERIRKAEESEKAEIAAKLLEKQRRADLEKQVRLELIDSGQLYPEAGKRPPIPDDVRDAVWRRDGARCVKCGSTENLQFDHIIPFSKGGATSVENLQLLCQKCNLEKSNKIG